MGGWKAEQWQEDPTQLVCSVNDRGIRVANGFCLSREDAEARALRMWWAFIHSQGLAAVLHTGEWERMNGTDANGIDENPIGHQNLPWELDSLAESVMEGTRKGPGTSPCLAEVCPRGCLI